MRNLGLLADRDGTDPRARIHPQLGRYRRCFVNSRTSVRSMSSGVVSDREEVLAVVARWEQAQAELATVSFTVLTATRSTHYSEAAGKGIPQPAGSRSQADSSAHLPWHADSARRQFLAQGAFRSAADLRGRGQPAHQAGRTLGATDCVERGDIAPGAAERGRSTGTRRHRARTRSESSKSSSTI